jgi:transposase
MARLLLSDKQWKRIEHLLPKSKSRNKGGRPVVDRRKVLDGVFWILRTGAPWRDMPEQFGSWQTAWRLFDEYNGDGTLDRILRSLQTAHMHNGDLNHELWCIDGSVIRAARCAAGGGKKGIRKSRQITH